MSIEQYGENDSMNYLFPSAFAVNTLSMTGLLVVASLAGDPIFAADIGLVQAATLALFYAFSGNTRSAILNQKSGITAHSVFVTRLILLLPLAAAAYWLSSIVANVPPLLTIILIVRRSVEWFDEVFLSEMERLDIKNLAKKYASFQVVLLIIILVWMLLKLPFFLYGLFLWALLPLILSAKFHYKSIQKLLPLSFQIISKNLLPHIGSSMIIGMTVYVFRLLLMMMAGKAVAGDLMTAFAIGGVLGSVFANALGPSLALHQKRNSNHSMPPFIGHLLIVFFSLGLLLFILALLEIPSLSLSGKTFLFWQAVGLSMVAGVIMVFAQIIRHRLLQYHHELNLFGPDVIMNILIIAAVPFSYYLFGIKILTALYLLSSIFAYLFYKSYELKEIYKNSFAITHEKTIAAIIISTLLIPVFFQVSSGVFNDPAMTFNTQGKLSLLPIPLSAFGCFCGILIIGSYQKALTAFTFIFVTFIFMIFTTFLITGKDTFLQGTKFILLIQFIMPMFGLVLGQFFHQNIDNDLLIEKVFAPILLIFVPLQLVCTWLQGTDYLSPYLYIISIYQHVQYVPVIFSAAYLIVIVKLWILKEYHIYLIALTLCMSLYVMASISLIAIFMFFLGLLIFTFYHYKTHNNKKLIFLFIIALLVSFFYAVTFTRVKMAEKIPIGFTGNHFPSLASQTNSHIAPLISDVAIMPVAPLNLLERQPIWEYYFTSIIQNSQSLLLGQVERPNRALYPSAHNYYLDFIYNFGLLSFFPFLCLIGYTIQAIVRCTIVIKQLAKNDAISFILLSGVVIFLLIIDNSFKVSLRQPFSGIFTFFLWGLLLNNLSFILKSQRLPENSIALK